MKKESRKKKEIIALSINSRKSLKIVVLLVCFDSHNNAFRMVIICCAFPPSRVSVLLSSIRMMSKPKKKTAIQIIEFTSCFPSIWQNDGKSLLVFIKAVRLLVTSCNAFTVRVMST